MKTRIFRSPEARYYAEDILEGPDVYSDSVLAGIRSHGFNGVWLRARLRDACRTGAFPELGAEAPRYHERLNTLCERAARHGVRVFLYFNEPLCFPTDHAFWTQHPDVKGVPGSSGMDEWPQTFACCTSTPQVQAFLRDGSADLFRNCPRLGGVFTITRSEHHTHCLSHVWGEKPSGCPRCDARDAATVVAEVSNLVAAGIHSVAPQAEVIAWNWAWDSGGGTLEPRIIEKLAPDVIVMADFERGGHKTIRGKDRLINEYSLGYVGPSEEFQSVARQVQAQARRLFVKIQIGTTHEIATVNNLPLIPNLLGKARKLQAAGVDGTLACWNFGSRLTLNTWAFNRFLDDPQLAAKSDTEVLAAVARDYLGVAVADSATVLAAWERFVQAFDHYPFHVCFLYSSPVNYAVVYPLPRPGDPDRPMQWTWIPLKKPYGTRLSQTSTHEWGQTGFSLADCRDAFRDMARLWGEGLELYARALSAATKPEAARELRNARVIHHILQSTANIYAAYLLTQVTPFDEDAWQAVARAEAAHLAELLPWLRGEQELGFHSEAASWFFTAAEVEQKLASLAMFSRFRDWGVPVRAPVGGGPFVGRDGDGRTCLYTVMGQESNKADMFVLQVDIETGACQRFNPPPGVSGARPCLWSERHQKLFIGASALEHREGRDSGWLLYLDPKTGKIAMAGKGGLKPGGVVQPVSVAEAPDGTVYVGCYGNCELFSYDVKQDRVQAHGRLDPVDQYLYVACGGDGTVAGLVKMTRPHVVLFDPATGQQRAVGPAADVQAGTGRVNLMTGADGLLYLDTHEGVFRLRGLDAVPVPQLPAAAKGGLLPDGSSCRFLDGHPEKAHAWRTLEIRRPDGSQKVLRLDYEADGTGIYIVRAGPDGLIYGSSILPMHFFTLDPASGRLRDYGACSTASGEAYSMDWLDGKLYLAVYTHALLCEYDPQRPYSFSSLEERDGELRLRDGTWSADGNLGFAFGPDDNPRQLGRLDAVAYRSRDMVAGPAGKVWVVSMPDYGMWGGTLSWYDPKAKRFGGAHRNIIPDCSPVSLAYLPGDDLLLLGFCIYGGSGTQPRARTTGFALWDPNRDALVWTGDLGLEIVGVMDVHGIGNGLAYAIVHPYPDTVLHAWLILFNPRQQTIISRTRLDAVAGWPLEVSFQTDAKYLYGVTREAVYRVPLGTTDVEVLWRTEAERGPTGAGTLLNGSYYFGSLARLQSVNVT